MDKFAPAFKLAEIAQLVEHDLAKVGVAGSSPVFRSISLNYLVIYYLPARVAELVDALDLKSSGLFWLCGFKSRSGYRKRGQRP
jgi:hypothetical protein